MLPSLFLIAAIFSFLGFFAADWHPDGASFQLKLFALYALARCVHYITYEEST